jgi:predicted RNA binding protein YcfA (HicA-like mRNA interferase family)
VNRGDPFAEAREILSGKGTGWRYADLERLLLRAGYLIVHTRGSHVYFRHPAVPRERVLLVHRTGDILPAYAKDAAKAILAVPQEGNDAEGN